MNATPDADSPSFGDYRFVSHTRVDVADTDLGGIVYYGRYSLFVDRGVLDYRRHLGIPVLGPPGHLFVVRALEMEYHAAARFDEVLEVWVRTVAVGRTSHRSEVLVARQDDGQRTALVRAGVTVVGVSDYANPRPTRLPADLAAALRRFEGLPDEDAGAARA